METPHQRALRNVLLMFQCSDLAYPKLALSVVPRKKSQYLAKGLRFFEVLL